MAQLFRPGANSILRVALFAILLVPLGAAAIAMALQRTPYITGEGRFIEQQVPFSHKHHAGELGIDCRFCHVGVENQAVATVPTTEVCMTCHSQMWTNAAMLAPVRRSWATHTSLMWSRVNRLPDYVYFDHHAHVENGVPCAACHGDVRQMPLTRQAAPLTMGWCLDCHNDPEKRLVPEKRITWSHPYDQPLSEAEARRIHAHVAALDKTRKLTDCSTCHR
ncbi:MAG TPA: cytochrome c3 family protein [Sphingomonas sp.]|nr:cytochrome c3 family protein [Sphingomonas sp.]